MQACGRDQLAAAQIFSQRLAEDAIPTLHRVQLLRFFSQPGKEAGDAQVGAPRRLLLAMRAAHRQGSPAVAAAGDCPQNPARRPDDTVGEQHAWRASDGTAGLSAHRPLLCQLASKSGAVGRRAALVSHLERGTAKISARPATDPARTPAAGLTRQLRLQIGAQIAAAPGVNCRI